MDNRAASETLGFVFAFALVTASVGAVYTAGFGGLQDAQRAEQLRNVERAFDVLDSNVRDVTRGDAPSRATEIKLSGGTVGFLNEMEMVVGTNGTGCSGSCDHLNTTPTSFTLRPVSYEQDASRITYASGSVFRTDDGSSVMKSEPGWVVDDERVLIPVITTEKIGDRSGIAGDSNVLLIANTQSRKVTASPSVTDGSSARIEVNVTVRSVRADAWKRYLEEQGFTITNYDPDRYVVSATRETKRATLVRIGVGVRLSR